LLFLTFLISTCISNAQNLPSTLLWKISGNGLQKPSYLYGTMHLTDERIFNLGDSLYKAIETSDGFAIEINPDDLTELIIAEAKKNIMAARRIKDMLSEKEFKHISDQDLLARYHNNRDNRLAHYLSTGPEIWEETNGTIDGFVCSVGTGGTLAGTSIFLREKKKDIVIGVADPRGAAMYNLFSTGLAKSTDGGSITEGIGLGRITPIIDDIKVDKPYLIPDEEAVPIIFDLLEHEGLCLGGSSGINVAGAIRLAKDLGPGKTIVTVLADSGTRYQSKLFNPEFLRSKKLPVPAWLEKKSNVEIPFEKA